MGAGCRAPPREATPDADLVVRGRCVRCQQVLYRSPRRASSAWEPDERRWPKPVTAAMVETT
jgi:hypothetical protein